MTTAIIFPGQGSQQPGMAAPWRDVSSFDRWAQADELLGRDVSRLGTDADADELREPWSCQVALFTHHVVILEALRDVRPDLQPTAVAGHSLGEYDALVAAGALDFAAGLRLVDVRARETAAAAEAMPGTMIAALGVDVDVVEQACQQAGAHVANDNAVGQVTVSGTEEQLAEVTRILSEGRAKVLPIPVGAAYHSPHMQAAVEPLGVALDATGFADATVPVYANVDAAPHTAAGEWPDLLRRQVVSPVRWRETVLNMTADGITDVVELGASAVLGPMIKRIDRSIDRTAITTPDDL